MYYRESKLKVCVVHCGPAELGQVRESIDTPDYKVFIALQKSRKHTIDKIFICFFWLKDDLSVEHTMKRIAGCLVLVSKDVPVDVSEVAAERHGEEGVPHILHLIQQS